MAVQRSSQVDETILDQPGRPRGDDVSAGGKPIGKTKWENQMGKLWEKGNFSKKPWAISGDTHRNLLRSDFSMVFVGLKHENVGRCVDILRCCRV